MVERLPGVSEVDHSPVARRWLPSIASRLARSPMRIVELLSRLLSTQVAALLLDEAVDGEVRFPQRTLAAMLGVHRQALNRALKALEDAGAVEYGVGTALVTAVVVVAALRTGRPEPPTWSWPAGADGASG